MSHQDFLQVRSLRSQHQIIVLLEHHTHIPHSIAAVSGPAQALQLSGRGPEGKSSISVRHPPPTPSTPSPSCTLTTILNTCSTLV
jgi:hypothetical protein